MKDPYCSSCHELLENNWHEIQDESFGVTQNKTALRLICSVCYLDYLGGNEWEQ